MIPSSPRRFALAAVACSLLLAPTAFAERSFPTPLEERARGAERVVVATVVGTTASYRENAHGDRLIVTKAKLRVESHWKGAPITTLDVDVEGGTVDGVTLSVSDLPTVAPGERAIFFLQSAPGGGFVPHLRGKGILKLDEQDRVRGTRLSLAEAKRIAMQER